MDGSISRESREREKKGGRFFQNNRISFFSFEFFFVLK